jgi:hypothetical protein
MLGSSIDTSRSARRRRRTAGVDGATSTCGCRSRGRGSPDGCGGAVPSRCQPDAGADPGPGRRRVGARSLPRRRDDVVGVARDAKCSLDETAAVLLRAAGAARRPAPLLVRGRRRRGRPSSRPCGPPIRGCRRRTCRVRRRSRWCCSRSGRRDRHWRARPDRLLLAALGLYGRSRIGRARRAGSASGWRSGPDARGCGRRREGAGWRRAASRRATAGGLSMPLLRQWLFGSIRSTR